MIFVESLFVFVFIAFIWLVIMLIMFKKLNRARITGVLLILMAFIGVAAVLFVVGHALEWHETNEFCGDMCHSMKEGPYTSYTQPKNNTMMETHLEADVVCAQCHSGPGFVGLGTSFLPVPEETLREYLLGYDPDDFGGHVPAENCIKGCHEEARVDWKFEAPMPPGEGYSEINGVIAWERREIYHPLTDEGTNFEALKELETCLECHDARDNSFGFAAEACHVCHDIDNEELEAHGETTCAMATCHRDSEGNPVQPKLTGHNTVVDHCMECHSRDHPDNAFVPYTITNSVGTTLEVNGTFCADCHQETYQELSFTNPKHFEENDCTDCHEKHKTRPDCASSSCHGAAEYSPEHTISEPFDDCSDCHERGGHDPKSVSFESQESIVLSKDFCNSCHQEDVYDKLEDNKTHKRQDFTEDCLSCHDVHEADVDCLSCHVEGGFDGLAPVPVHLVTQPFDECLSCHVEGHDPSELNFTNFQEDLQISIDDDFCIECHADEQTELMNLGESHATQECSSCHETHDKDDVDCLSCHNDQGPAFEPLHPTQNPYDDCLSCHESGHTPRVLVPQLPEVDREFCAAVSCHGGPEGVATIFENYGANHEGIFKECTDCHSAHEVGSICTDAGCHSTRPSSHDPTYTFEECVSCHKSAHDPLKRSLQPGSSLSQRDYMSNYFKLNTDIMSESFKWVERGNHDVFTDCTQCHADPESISYPVTAVPLLNASGVDCAGSCHGWIDPASSGTPYSLLPDTASKFTAHFEMFNGSINGTSGGCAGFCHQNNPESPVFDGSGHGVLTNCLSGACHKPEFSLNGATHVKHQDMLSLSDLDCYQACHKGGIEYGAPIDGGCYDCHKSGHNPRIIPTSPCSDCHASNIP